MARKKLSKTSNKQCFSEKESEENLVKKVADTSNLAKLVVFTVKYPIHTKNSTQKIPLTFFIHSGACVTLINWSTYREIGSPELKETSKKIFPYSATKPMVLLGKYTATFRYCKTKVDENIYVVAEDYNSPCIMGRSASEKLGILKIDPSTSMKWSSFFSNVLKCRDDEKRPATEVIRLRNTKLEFLVSSGAIVTLIDRLTYAKIGSPALTQTDLVIFTYTAKKPLVLLGKFETILARAEFTSRTSVYVADVKKPSCVLSKSVSEELGLLKLRPNYFHFEFSYILL